MGIRGAHFGGAYIHLTPARLAAKILRREFVEMHELLPEFWQDQKGGKAGDRAKAKKRALDQNVWLQCYAVYVGVLGPKYIPPRSPRTDGLHDFHHPGQSGVRGVGLGSHDAAYRRQAAAQGKTEWSRVNPSLYAICFTGKARRTDRCDRCLSTTHKAEDCSLLSEDDPDVSQRLKTIESAVVALTRAAPGGASKPRVRSAEACRNWNRSKCSFPGCRYAHHCSSCRGSHPAVECPARSANTHPIGPTHRNPQSPWVHANPPY